MVEIAWARPPWESDPSLLNAGPSFDVGWLMGDVDGAECFVYEIHERMPGTHLAESRPVYVGITRDFPARWGEHRAHSWWFKRMEPYCVLLSGYPTRQDALKREALLIDEYRPIFNKKAERTTLLRARSIPPTDDLFMAELRVRGRSGEGVRAA